MKYLSLSQNSSSELRCPPLAGRTHPPLRQGLSPISPGSHIPPLQFPFTRERVPRSVDVIALLWVIEGYLHWAKGPRIRRVVEAHTCPVSSKTNHPASGVWTNPTPGAKQVVVEIRYRSPLHRTLSTTHLCSRSNAIWGFLVAMGDRSCGPDTPPA